MKIKELKQGMKNINLIAEIDYIPPHYKEKRWGIIFVKDSTKDIKMILAGENMKKAKEGMKIRITKGFVTETRGSLQLNTTKEHPVELIEEK